MWTVNFLSLTTEFETPETCELLSWYLRGCNSRTSTLLGYIIFDKYLDEHLSDVLSTCYIPIRSNMARIIDTNGIRLLETCQATGLLLVSGRLSNDENKGQFNFCSHTGQSTVDYLMTNFFDFTTIPF